MLVIRLANYLSRMGVENSLLTNEILPEIESDLDNTQLIIPPISKTRAKGKIAKLTSEYLWLRKIIRNKRNDFDLINVHNYPAELCTFPYSTPVVWMCNEPPDVAVQSRLAQTSRLSAKRLFFKAFLTFDRYVVGNYVKNVVVADQFNAERFINLYGFEPYTIHYGIDYDFFSLQTEAESLKSEHPFTILHVGMLTPLKNQIESLKTIAKLKNMIPDVKLIIAGFGEGQYLQVIREYIRAHQLERNVEITGHLNRDRIRTLFQTCHVLLHPIKSQGGWLAPFEAICAKLPVVVSPEMTAADIVKRENLGIVTVDYANALFDVYQNFEKHRKLAVRRAEWVRDNLSWDNFSERMMHVFQKTLAENQH